MRWFGGTVTTNEETAPIPVEATVLWSGATSLWLVGDWPAHEVRVSGAGPGRVAVIGPCGISADALAHLREGVPDEAVMAWPGAYTVLHAVGDRVTVLTDPAGSSPIYLTQAGPGSAMVWASSSRALASLAGGGVDLGWLAARLLSPSVTVAGGRSAFAGVGLVQAGHRLRLRAGALPESAPIRWPRPDPAAHTPKHLRTVLANAVAIRVAPASTPTADCSGGLDSTTLCLLAARTKPVTAFTIHPAGMSTGGDLDYARAATTGHANIEHVLMPMSTEHDPCTALDTVPPSDEPAPSTLTYARLAAQLRHLAALGSDAHLTGDGGDTLFMLPPQYLADLLRAGHLTRFVRDVLGWARLRRVSPWQILAAAISAIRAPRAVPAWSPYAATATGDSDWATPLARELAADLTSGAAWNPPGLDRAGSVTLAETQLVARTARADAQLADAHGVPLHNPMLDSRVLAAVLAVPAHLRGSPRTYKPMLSAAVADLLPPAVANRGTKGVFDADHYRGIRANLAALIPLADGQLACAGLVTPTALRTMLKQAAAGLPVALASLEAVLAAEVWLRVVNAAPPIAWTTAIAAPATEPV